jgi:hypothetical protein
MKKYRFFFHYRKSTAGMTVHFKKSCAAVKEISCNVPVETKWSKNQPNIVMQGWANSVEIKNNRAIIK